MYRFFKNMRRIVINVFVFFALGASVGFAQAPTIRDMNVFVNFLINQALDQENIEMIESLALAGLIDKATATYVLGIIAAQQDRLKDATTLMETSVEFDPNRFAPRYALVDLLLADYRFVSAQNAADNLKMMNIDTAIVSQVETLLERVPPADDYTYSGWLALRPSTNINRGTYETEVNSIFGKGEISEESRQMSGIGIEAGLHFEASHSFADHADVITRADVYTVQYIDEERTLTRGDFSHEYGMDAYGGRIELGLRQRHYNGSFEVAVFSGLHVTDAGRIVGGFSDEPRFARANSSSYGFALRGDFLPAKDMRLAASFEQDMRRYIDSAYQYANSETKSFHASVQKSLEDTASMSFSFAIAHHDETLLQNSYTDMNIGFDYMRRFGEDWSFGLGYQYSGLTEKAPALFEEKATRVYSNTLSVIAQNNSWKLYDSVPRLRCRYREAQSKDVFSRYNAFDCSLEFAKEF